jgi:hypothetical protein
MAPYRRHREEWSLSDGFGHRVRVFFNEGDSSPEERDDAEHASSFRVASVAHTSRGATYVFGSYVRAGSPSHPPPTVLLTDRPTTGTCSP